MKLIIVFAACLLTVVSAHSLGTTKEQILAAANERVNKCGEQHNLTKETVADLYKPGQFSKVEPTENVKCFTKCVSESFEHLSANGDIVVESVVSVANAFGRDEAQVRAKLDSCKAVNSGLKTCDDFFKATLCYENA